MNVLIDHLPHIFLIFLVQPASDILSGAALVELVTPQSKPVQEWVKTSLNQSLLLVAVSLFHNHCDPRYNIESTYKN